MKNFSKKLLFHTILSLIILSLTALISCEDYLPVTGGTEPGGTNPGWMDYDDIDSVPGLANKLTWLKIHALSGSSHIIVVDADESIRLQNLSFDSGRKNITITLRGDGINRIISLSNNVKTNMFQVRTGVTLILENNITLRGHNSNAYPLIYIEPGGTLRMNNGAAITGNTSKNNISGGVAVYGTFTMSGGTISGNNAGSGGGVYVPSGGKFTMSDGTISGNSASKGGGVYIYIGDFTMSGGTISGNTADESGGGVYVFGHFTMWGGTISDNNAGSGAGVYCSGNIGGSSYSGSSSMIGGIISGNNATNYGGGVYIGGNNFQKNGGIITGYPSDQSNGNVVRDSSGIVQSNRGHAVYTNTKRKETTAGPGVNLSLSSNDGWDFY